jgi:hypothetical protein
MRRPAPARLKARLDRCFAIAYAHLSPWPPSKVRRFHRKVDVVHRRLMRLASERLQALKERAS